MLLADIKEVIKASPAIQIQGRITHLQRRAWNVLLANAYVCEKIEMSFSAADVKNRGGYVIEAIRENYQDEQVRKERQVRAEKLKEQALEDLTASLYLKRNNIVRQAIQADPMLIEKAAERVETHHPESDSKNTRQPLKPIRKVLWSKSLLTKSSLTNSAKTASHPSPKPMRTKRHAS